jgi:protein SCO1/2
MISGCLNKKQFLLALLFLVLSPLGLHAHVPGASREFAPTSTGLNTKAANFVLLDQDGKSFDSTNLRGKVVVVNFIFTTCTDVCPMFTANLAQLQRALKKGPAAGDLFFVSITTDPEVDSPKVLKSYAQRYSADFQNWAFLSGTDAQMKAVWKGFGVRVVRKGRGLVQHTSLTTVIDREGIRRFNYFGEKWQLKDLQNDIAGILAKKPNH